MGQLTKTTEKVNELLDKVDGMPEEVKDGKTPVLETGTTTTLDPGQQATSEVVANGTDESGNPKYKLNFGIPKGYDGAGGSGGGGTADSVQWANVLNKPSWVNSDTKPTYTASEVGALPSDTQIPSKTSQLTNDSGYTTSTSFKTINGESIVGSGNIVIEDGGGSDTPSSGGNVNVTNGSSLQSASYYAFKPSEDGSLEGTFGVIPNASSTSGGLMSSDDKSKLDDMKPVWKVPIAVLSLTDESTSEEIATAFRAGLSQIETVIAYLAGSLAQEYNSQIPMKVFIGNNECLLSSNVTDNDYTLDFNYVDAGKLKTISISTNNETLSCKLSESGGSDDGTYYLSNKVYNLTANATHAEILEAFGGEDGLKEAIQALKDKRELCIYFNTLNIAGERINVDASFYGTAILSICYYKGNQSNKRLTHIKCNIRDNIQSEVKVIYPGGYTLNSKVYLLTSASTSDDISAAVGGESGMKNIIQAVKDGNRLVIRGTDDSLLGSEINQDLMCNVYKEEDNGDMNLMVYGYGYGLFGGLGGLFQIQYTKSSNTFNVQLLSKS